MRTIRCAVALLVLVVSAKPLAAQKVVFEGRLFTPRVTYGSAGIDPREPPAITSVCPGCVKDGVIVVELTLTEPECEDVGTPADPCRWSATYPWGEEVGNLGTVSIGSNRWSLDEGSATLGGGKSLTSLKMHNRIVANRRPVDPTRIAINADLRAAADLLSRGKVVPNLALAAANPDPDNGVGFTLKGTGSLQFSWCLQGNDDCVTGQVGFEVTRIRTSEDSNAPKPPCGDSRILAEYPDYHPDRHLNEVTTEICKDGEAGCDPDAVYRLMLSQARYQAPAGHADIDKPVTNCALLRLKIVEWGSTVMKEFYDIGPRRGNSLSAYVRLGSGIPVVYGGVRHAQLLLEVMEDWEDHVDPVRVQLDPKNRSATNYTLPGHRLHPGKVVRTVVHRDGAVLVHTQGSGVGDLGTINRIAGGEIFCWIDARMVAALASRHNRDAATACRVDWHLAPEGALRWR